MIRWRAPIDRMVWADPRRRARKLMQFAEVEAQGARDLFRAAEVTPDPHLRRRLFAHARDEVRHAALFRARGLALRRTLADPGPDRALGDGLIPGERGFDRLEVEKESMAALLAFIHLSERAAAHAFAAYGAVLGHDPETRAVIARIARDEEGHMRYSRAELARLAPDQGRRALWIARLRRLWRAYLRLALILADLISRLILTLVYFLLLAPFAWMAKRSARRQAPGWRACVDRSRDGGGGQY
ncbi:ferritin-like domain-containing protein [Sphingobium sp. Sx8-8]|uniref:ferritin-like domain-containing protein n=1 Tax=Sphingobium sp. Sx8-8 TaxID=2933617 RepID=UPI001F5A2CA1|nr:ferritin-like domain-containing protein [Sphingobium sp. Sx8-8]